MSDLKLYDVTDTDLTLHATIPTWRRLGHYGHAAAVEEWLRFHAIDLMHVVLGYSLRRETEQRRITYVTTDEIAHRQRLPIVSPAWLSGNLVVVAEQGEAAPLPFPQLLFDEPLVMVAADWARLNTTMGGHQ